jgi:hypothetical protein
MLRDRWEQELRADPAVTGKMLLTLLDLGTYANRDGTFIDRQTGNSVAPGQRRLAADTGQGESTVRRHLGHGCRLGYLQQESRGHRRGDRLAVCSVYRLTIPGDVQPLTAERLSDSSTAHPTDLNRSADADLNRSPVSANQLENQTTPPAKRRRAVHVHESNARDALARLRDEQRLDISVGDLLDLAYEMDPDPVLRGLHADPGRRPLRHVQRRPRPTQGASTPGRTDQRPEDSMTDDTGSLPALAIHLGNGWSLLEAVRSDGRTDLWLLNETSRDGDDGCACERCAPHEQPGLLWWPRRHRHRELCGHPTTDGHPCRNPASVCRFHGPRHPTARTGS